MIKSKRRGVMIGIDRSGGFIYADDATDDSYWVDPRQRRDKQSHPYSYSEHYMFRVDDLSGCETAYSDRLFGWDAAKWNEAAAAVQTQARLTHWHKSDCDIFLTKYFDKPIRTYALAEGCNPATQYPYWIFWYKHVPEETTEPLTGETA
jgi:hypothetical protein